MYRHNEDWFGVIIEPGLNDYNKNTLATVQLMTGRKGDIENWGRLGSVFSASQLADLIKALQRAQKVLDADYTKSPDGYRTRNAFF